MKRSNELAALLTITRRKLTTRQVSEAIHVSEYAAYRALVSLVQSGDVERSHVGGVSYWHATVKGLSALAELRADVAAAIDN